MMRIVIVTALVLLLAGCSAQRALIADRGAEAADAQLESAEWAFCQLPTMGAYVRRFDGYPEEREAYSKLCWPGSDTPVPPDETDQ